MNSLKHKLIALLSVVVIVAAVVVLPGCKKSRTEPAPAEKTKRTVPDTGIE